jgi:WS/DGAT/MGAT family acyltransferase
MDRLSALDASFLAQEGPNTHMHIGAAAIFRGPAPSREQFLEHVGDRLALVPRYRQKLAQVPWGLGRARWIDDPTFNLDYHVRHSALPRPGDEEQLRRLIGRVFSQPLDRTRPLWELWLVEGLSRRRFALIAKTHHALVDGVSGVDLTSMLFDPTPTPRRLEVEDRWQPGPAPTPVQLTASALSGWAQTLARIPWRLATAAARPAAAATGVLELLEGVGEIARGSPAPENPLNVAVGPHRRVAFVPASLAELKLIKDAFGGTVNDVVLSVVAGALAHFFHARGLRVENLDLRVCVPISRRSETEGAAKGNRITQVVVALPVQIEDPVARLAAVRRSMDGVKHSKQAMGAEAIAAAQEFAPPTILAQASRLNFSSRFYNVLVTNVPGPQVPLYLCGHQLESVFPVAFLAGDRALAVAAMSYNGGINFGLIADYDAVADLDVVAEGIEASLAELVRGARRATRRRSRPAHPSTPRPSAPRLSTPRSTGSPRARSPKSGPRSP